MAAVIHGFTAPDCGYLEVDSQGTVLAANDCFLAWVDRSMSDVVGQPLAFVLDTHLPISGDSLIARADASLRHRSGTTRSAVVGLLGTTQLGVHRVAVFDDSAGREFDRASRGRARRSQILLDAAVGFANALSEESAAELLADIAGRAFAATSVSVHLERDDWLEQVAGENPLLPHWPTDMEPAGSRTFHGREIIVIHSPDEAALHLPGADTAYRAAGIHAALASPLVYEDQTLGAMVCYFDHPRQFDEEAAPLAEALAKQAGQAIARIRLEEALRRSAMLDDVTGLPTRRLFEEELATLAPGPSASVAVVFVDLDGFKAVNDQLGHAAGDRLLHEVGGRLRRVVRDHDAVGRFGGDEFIVASVTDEPGALALAERIRHELGQPYPQIPAGLRISASVGVVVSHSFGGAGRVTDRLIRAADHAMYDAKSAGLNIPRGLTTATTCTIRPGARG